MRYAWVLFVAIIAGCGQAGNAVPTATAITGHSSQASLSPSAAKWYVDGARGRNRNICNSPERPCKTIHRAIELSSPGDSVVVGGGTYFENLSVPFSLNVVGSGAKSTIVDGRGIASVFLISHRNSTVTLSGMTMRNGGGLGDGGAVYNCFTKNVTIADSILTGNTALKGKGSAGFGGAIYNCPTNGTHLTIVDSTISNNSAEEGGAICNGGALTILNSTFFGNVARAGRGGAIRNYGILRIANSTFSGNDATNGSGGAVHNGKFTGLTGSLEMSSSTVSGNSGGGIYNRTGITALLRNTIVADNAGRNCQGVMTSGGYNLSSDLTCTFDKTGDVTNVQPQLNPLQDNGGPTLTMSLRASSPAIDAGNPGGCRDDRRLLTTDQRGRPRPDAEDSGGCDIGAFERQRD